MKKVLWVSDGYVMTGFGRVAHSILERISGKYEIHHLAINYYGQPHNYPWKMYPASLGGDIWGFSYLPKMLKSYKFDSIVLFNDLHVIAYYLESIKNSGVNVKDTNIIVYFPVDSEYMNKEWFKDYDIVSYVATFSNFGVNQVLPFLGETHKDKIFIIRHGVDKNRFRKMSKEEAIEYLIYGITEGKAKEDFVRDLRQKLRKTKVILNANRNQPRKRVDLTIMGFSEFVKKNKLTPDDVSLYLHMGTVDMGVDIIKLSFMYGIEDYIILSHAEKQHKFYPDDVLNAIYNVADIGINTSMGEGFGLVSVEHASVGKPQIVPKNSVLPEIWGPYAYYIDCPLVRWADVTTVMFREALPSTVAKALEEAFFDENPKIMKNIFRDKEYSWGFISERFSELIDGKIS